MIYMVGLVLVVLASIPGEASPGLVFPAMYIIAIGTGGIKPNVSTMGADQFDDRYSKDRREKESFFNWFYWSINLGAGISYTLVSYICQYGLPDLGGQNWGFFVGYMIP
jgi:peptide/histidine transporter 3/4